MNNLKVLAKFGVTSDALRELFTAELDARGIPRYGKDDKGDYGVDYRKPDVKPKGKSKKLKQAPDDFKSFYSRLRGRIYDGVNWTFANYKYPLAVDHAFDAPFNQTTETFIQLLQQRDPDNASEWLSSIKEWGLTHLLNDQIDPKSGKKTGKKVMNLPTFYNVTIPLVRAYVTIRAAKLYNDRNQSPIFQYEPIQNTALNRLRCDIVTDRIQMTSQQFRYNDILKDAILNCVKYGTQFQFPQEEWYKESRVTSSFDLNKKEVYKEGIRYHLSHPSRTYHDLSYPIRSFNSDTGGEFAGNWRVFKYADIRYNKKLWNLDRVAISNKDWKTSNELFFANVYPQSALSFPNSKIFGSDADREKIMQEWYYASHFDDSAVIITDHFEKVVPKDIGLGDYDEPVWFKFMVASDDSVLYATPLPSSPIIAYEYDPDGYKAYNVGLALEAMPFQDHISNLLSQLYLSIKQNLTNMTFYDKNLIGDDQVRDMQNTGESRYRRLNFIGVDNRNHALTGQKIEDAFKSFKFPYMPWEGHMTAINQTLTLLERVLGISAQEVGGSATHEITAEESRNISQSTDNRLAYTGSGIDSAIDAWKHQLYNYHREFGSDEIRAHVMLNNLTKEVVEKIGITVLEEALLPFDKTKVSIKSGDLALDFFANNKPEINRSSQSGLAANMINTLSAFVGIPGITEAVGSEQLIKMLNQILETAGFPRDFTLIPSGATESGEVQAQMAEQIQQYVDQADQQLLETLGGQLEQLAQAVNLLTEGVQVNTQELEGIKSDHAQVMQAMEADVPPEAQQQ